MKPQDLSTLAKSTEVSQDPGFALSYPQLMNQVLILGWDKKDLTQLKAAYEFAETRFDGYYRAQGMPFLCHLIRTASILIAEKMPCEVVIAGLIHSAYLIDEGNCKDPALVNRLRKEVRETVGAEVEHLVYEYNRLPWYKNEILQNYLNRTKPFDPATRYLIAMHLANELEDYMDFAMAYRGIADPRERLNRFGSSLIELARKIGMPQTAGLMEKTFAEYKTKEIPGDLKRSYRNLYEHPERQWMKLSTRNRIKTLLRVKWRNLIRMFVDEENKALKARTVAFDTSEIFHELNELIMDHALLEKASACIAHHQKEQEKIKSQNFKENLKAAAAVSSEALAEILKKGEEVHGIATQRDISNCIVFNAPYIHDAVKSAEIEDLRTDLNREVFRVLNRILQSSKRIRINDSGHFWYPAGGFMGWHTNFKSPGWRLYINYAEEPGKSFFRYRDTETGEIKTVWDKRWNFRLFKIMPEKPFWHAIYSETNRYSFGYRITLDPAPPKWVRALNKIKRILTRVGEKFITKEGKS